MIEEKRGHHESTREVRNLKRINRQQSTLKAPETKSDTVGMRPSCASIEPTIPKRHKIMYLVNKEFPSFQTSLYKCKLTSKYFEKGRYHQYGYTITIKHSTSHPNTTS